MIRFHKKLFRRGLNQLGVLVMAAGLIAFFINPAEDMNEWKIILFGWLLYTYSVIGRIQTLAVSPSWRRLCLT